MIQNRSLIAYSWVWLDHWSSIWALTSPIGFHPAGIYRSGHPIRIHPPGPKQPPRARAQKIETAILQVHWEEPVGKRKKMGGGGRGGRNRARTQRKHFRENRENVWKRSRHESSDSNTNSGWEPFATQNPAFDEYYKVSYVDVLVISWSLFATWVNANCISIWFTQLDFLFSFKSMYRVSLFVVEAVVFTC